VRGCDVGLDEANRYYFVMKHVEGETLEHVILGRREPFAWLASD